MAQLTIYDYDTLAEAREKFNYSDRWKIFDGTKDNFNITHECIDRHPKDKVAVRIKFADGHIERYTFGELSSLTSKFANYLARQGVEKGDRVAVILNPSLEFYVTVFGTMKRGAVVVPCFPAFGPDAIGFRISTAQAKIAVAAPEKVADVDASSVQQIINSNDLLGLIQGESDQFTPTTSTDSLAFIQFSSGTTGTPKTIPYKHAAVTLTAVNLKILTGLRPEDEYYCPSSPAWGHGIWFGTVGPLIFGNAIGTYSGKFKAETFLDALEELQVTNISATPLVFRLAMECGQVPNHKLKLRTISYAGGPLDMETILYFQDKLGIVPRSTYGTTEIGTMLVQYPYKDFTPKPGSLGTGMLGIEVGIVDDDGNPAPAGEVGTIAVKRKDEWLLTGDAAYMDEDGHFYYKGRADDIIISAGYTIGPQEIEEVLMKHPAVERAAVVASPDQDRGDVVKAFIIPRQKPSEDLTRDIQEFIRARLSKHEYPREIEYIDQLPETPDGKVKRKELRERERVKKAAAAKAKQG